MPIGRNQIQGKKYGIKVVNQVKILGVYFSSNVPARSIDKNFDKKIEQIEKIFRIWNKRYLTLVGKIMIAKTYGLSKFVHLMQSIGIPDDKLKIINDMFFKFIWKHDNTNKKIIEKVKRQTMTNDIQYGGLNMINIINMQKSIYLQWGEKLITPTEEEWKNIPIASLKSVGGISAFKCNVNSNFLKGKNTILAPFWRTVLDTWLEHRNIKNNNINRKSPIFNNENITFKRNTIYIDQCVKAGIVTVGDCMEGDKFISYETFSNRYKFKANQLFFYKTLYL